MKMYASGVVTNEFNQVLLIKRDDSRTWAIPGGGMDLGELPPESATREVEEETGIKVVPARLVSVRYDPRKPDGALFFTFRCLQRGGRLTPSPESPEVGFHTTQPLPTPMLAMHRRIVAEAIGHKGGAPIWYTSKLPAYIRVGSSLLYGFRGWRRRVRGEAAFVPPAQWSVAAFVVIGNPAGQVLWIERTDKPFWNLPGGGREQDEAPWETAIRETYEETGLHVQLTHLSGVYLKHKKREVIFTFTATITGGTLTTGPEAASFAYVTPGQEPQNSFSKHVVRVADAVNGDGITLFREQ